MMEPTPGKEDIAPPMTKEKVLNTCKGSLAADLGTQKKHRGDYLLQHF